MLSGLGCNCNTFGTPCHMPVYEDRTVIPRVTARDKTALHYPNPNEYHLALGFDLQRRCQDFAFGAQTVRGPKLIFRGPRVTPPQLKKKNSTDFVDHFLRTQIH